MGKCRTRSQELLLLRGIDLRVAEIEVFHRLHDGGGDDEPREPLVVGRHNVPWRMLPRSRPDRFLERLRVAVPEATFLDIGRRELPAFLRVVEAIPETFFLLLARKVQKEFEDGRSLAGELVLQLCDISEPLASEAPAEAV